ncbi:GNAT family N-acetyltransferase [Streptomyces sp. NPDC102406]|uniref:GNAT family N-acetyltransferase n=1 Tax=Streptomyces sp. NPDC102406 TaxID=3366171 RepID=UPI0038239F3B
MSWSACVRNTGSAPTWARGRSDGQGDGHLRGRGRRADVGGSSVYVHRMAVCRRAAGLGALMLDWASDAARLSGAATLRLDCVRANTRLRAYYEARGFVHRGDVTVGGAPGQREGEGPVTWVSRYERDVSAG